MIKNKYFIEKDKILGLWIVWEREKNINIQVYKAHTKKQCKEWVGDHKCIDTDLKLKKRKNF